MVDEDDDGDAMKMIGDDGTLKTMMMMEDEELMMIDEEA